MARKWTCSVCEREFEGDRHICWPTPRAIINVLKDWWRNRHFDAQEHYRSKR